jgi:predicted aminopeptidase
MADDSQSLERAARDCLEQRYGRPLSDEEWASAKYALLELGKVLCDWNRASQRAA